MAALVFFVGIDRTPIINPGAVAIVTALGPGRIWIGNGGVQPLTDNLLIIGEAVSIKAPIDDFIYAISYGLPVAKVQVYEL